MSENITDVIKKADTVEKDLEKLKTTSGNMGNSFGAKKKTEEVKGQIDYLHKAQSTLEDTVTDFQCRSMRENLLFFLISGV